MPRVNSDQAFRCDCTPGYTCVGLCAISDANREAKRSHTTNWESVASKTVSEKQKIRMSLDDIRVRLTIFVYKCKPCCKKNCVRSMVDRFGMEVVAKAILAERTRVYHTNQNKAHEELREVLRRGQGTNSAVETFFFHNGLLQLEDNVHATKVIFRNL